jgi:hypothetical protein
MNRRQMIAFMFFTDGMVATVLSLTLLNGTWQLLGIAVGVVLFVLAAVLFASSVGDRNGLS